MGETRITDSGTFGPVFASGVSPQFDIKITEGIVEFVLMRYDAILMIEMTVDAADKLADILTNAITKQLGAS